jgi:predicted PurR-regulated permease PerM
MELNKNMGTVDRIVRIALALVLFGLIVTGTVSGVLAIIMGVVAAIFAVTTVVSFCPLYSAFKLSTRPE